MLHVYNEIPFSLLKHGNATIWDNTDEPGIYNAKWTKPGPEGDDTTR